MLDWVGYAAWVLICAASGGWYAWRQNKHRLDAAETGAIYACAGAMAGGALALVLLFLAWMG